MSAEPKAQVTDPSVSPAALSLLKDESRLKATAMDVKPVDFKEYSKRLIMNIRKNAAQLG